MSNARRWIRVLTAAALSVTALLVMGAGQALAVSWSTATGLVEGEGALTLELNGEDPVVCPEVKLSAQVYLFEYALFAYPSPGQTPMFSGDCETSPEGHPRGHLSIYTYGSAYYQDGSYSFSAAGGTMTQESPYGIYQLFGLGLTVENASEGQPSRMIFDHEELGPVYDNGFLGEMTATGAIELEDGQGGDVTLEGE